MLDMIYNRIKKRHWRVTAANVSKQFNIPYTDSMIYLQKLHEKGLLGLGRDGYYVKYKKSSKKIKNNSKGALHNNRSNWSNQNNLKTKKSILGLMFFLCQEMLNHKDKEVENALNQILELFRYNKEMEDLCERISKTVLGLDLEDNIVYFEKDKEI